MGARILPFVVSALLSVIVLFTPQSGVPSAWPGTDKVVHILLFALLMATGRYARLPLVPLTVGLIGYAAVSEALQWLITGLGRGGDVLDALTDVTGLALGYLVSRVPPVSGSRPR